jgi:hypothetical protein
MLGLVDGKIVPTGREWSIKQKARMDESMRAFITR